jgi:hypothetical protein
MGYLSYHSSLSIKLRVFLSELEIFINSGSVLLAQIGKKDGDRPKLATAADPN